MYAMLLANLAAYKLHVDAFRTIGLGALAIPQAKKRYVMIHRVFRRSVLPVVLQTCVFNFAINPKLLQCSVFGFMIDQASYSCSYTGMLLHMICTMAYAIKVYRAYNTSLMF